MRIHRAFQLLGFVLGCTLFASLGSSAQTLNAKDQLGRINYPQNGSDLFRSYCAPCHGSDAKGSGPVAPALKVKVLDLTVLAKNNRGQFPAGRVREMIMGDEVVASHGSRDMPIWGPIFQQIEKDQNLSKNVKVETLMQYLEFIQQK